MKKNFTKALILTSQLLTGVGMVALSVALASYTVVSIVLMLGGFTVLFFMFLAIVEDR